LFFSIVNAIIANYESAGLTDISAILMPIIISLIYCLLMSLFILTIFFNKLKRLNNNLIWNILSWFLLPFFYFTIIFIYDIDIRLKYEFGFGNDFLYLLMMTIPYFIGLCWTFIKYRQRITSANIV